MRPYFALAALLMLAGSCPPKIEGFVAIDRAVYEWRQMSSQGVIVAYRERPNDPEASLEFWAEVTEKELTLNRGYHLESKTEIPQGRSLLFAAPEERAYLLILLVDADWIRTLEAGGPREGVRREAAKLVELMGQKR